jgi:adenylate kinase family enzyme
MVIKKVAVFGNNAGGGKSTLSKRLSQITGLLLHVLDRIKYQSGGTEILHEDYKHMHQQILATVR